MQTPHDNSGYSAVTSRPEVSLVDALADAEFTTESIELRSGDVALPAILYLPAASTRRPAVIVAPGGLALGAPEEYRWAGERLARRGYVALIASYRSPLLQDSADIGLALDFLQSHERVDARSIGAFGHSRGGLSVLAAAAFAPRLRAVAAIAPPADLAEYASSVGGYFPAVRDAVYQMMGGSPREYPERYEAVRGLSLATRIRQPVLLIHGTADMRMPLPHAIQLDAALREAGNDRARLEIIPGMGHNLEAGTTGYLFDRVMDLVCDWLDGGLTAPA